MPALSSQSREDERLVMLAEGLFSGDNSLIATARELTPEAFHITEGSLLAGWWAYWQEGRLPPAAVNRQVLEQWQVSLPDDGQAQHTLRYLPPEASRLTIYVNDGSGWQAVDCGTVGSYLTFAVEGRSPLFAAVTSSPVWWMAAAAAGACLAVVLTVLLLRRRRRKRSPAAEAPAAESPAVQASQTAAPQAASDEPAPPSGRKSAAGGSRRVWRRALPPPWR